MEIRIIPMSNEDQEFIGKNIKEVQKDFFEESLVTKEKGWYYYAQSGLEAEENDLLLFQMNNSIIASAILDMVVNFPKPTSEGNYGAYVLKINTIKTFNPISKDELKEMINKFDSFNQTKQKFNSKEIDLKKLDERMKIK